MKVSDIILEQISQVQAIELVTEWLEENEYTGLYTYDPEPCSCLLNDGIMPCCAFECDTWMDCKARKF